MDAHSASLKLRPRSFDGWALEAISQYDAQAPGTLRRVLCASRLRRQAIFLALSMIGLDPTGDMKQRLRPLANPLSWAYNTDAEIAYILTTRRVRDITYALFGPVEGLAGALCRLGDSPLPKLSYRRLLNILRDPNLRHQAKVLLHLQQITTNTLSVLNLLDRMFLHPEIVRHFKRVEQVRQFNSAVDLIRHLAPQINDRDLVTSLKAGCGKRSGAAAWAQRWLEQSVFETVSLIQDDDELVALRSAAAMIDAGNRFGNCLGSKIPYVATGRKFYLEFKPNPAIIELIGFSDGSVKRWALEDVHAPKNAAASPELMSQVLQKLSETTILIPARLSYAQPYNGAARLMSIYDTMAGELHFLAKEPEEVDSLVEEDAHARRAA
ncbi:hypothetical protein ILT44_29510 [Microvirga sp. BT689]|uniref:hypothetical protein n=1 Tax=Microvirga arvi TaxID=2778731 RepID=UPI00194E75D6|nr:hypothetical protein [Microvirga arvi]MBM6584336.1 hypothetical protein [Microvirga arvi]